MNHGLTTVSVSLVLILGLSMLPVRAQEGKNLGLQRAENPPMQTISKTPPEPAPNPDDFDVRTGFRVIESLEAFRKVIKQDNQNIRMKPGVYRAETVDPPMEVELPRSGGTNEQAHIFAVNGSNNHFDLRGVVIETPVSVQSELPGKAHVADSWHINGENNTFEGGHFRNVLDQNYPDYGVTENEFEVCNDGNTFRDCTFVIKGSVPYGYSDFYGKGSSRWGRLDKHSFMSLSHANNTKLIGCELYMKSYGHGLHFHTVNGALVKDCYFTGTLRPTNDIYEENVGRAKEHDFNIMYRGERPIPRDQMLPLTEDGVRSYDSVKNIKVVNTTVERFRGAFQLLTEGDVELTNVIVREPGYFGYDVSAGDAGKVVMKNCVGDIAYSPLFHLTRGAVPKNDFYEVTVRNPAEGVEPTEGTNTGNTTHFGEIAGENTTFIFHDGTDRPLPENLRRLVCGSLKPLTHSKVVNHTRATVVLTGDVSNCTIQSVGPVEDNGENNTVLRIKPGVPDCRK